MLGLDLGVWITKDWAHRDRFRLDKRGKLRDSTWSNYGNASTPKEAALMLLALGRLPSSKYANTLCQRCKIGPYAND